MLLICFLTWHNFFRGQLDLCNLVFINIYCRLSFLFNLNTCNYLLFCHIYVFYNFAFFSLFFEWFVSRGEGEEEVHHWFFFLTWVVFNKIPFFGLGYEGVDSAIEDLFDHILQSINKKRKLHWLSVIKCWENLVDIFNFIVQSVVVLQWFVRTCAPCLPL